MRSRYWQLSMQSQSWTCVGRLGRSKLANVWVGCLYLGDSADNTFQTLQAYRIGRLDRSLEMNGERPIPASSLALSTPYRSYTCYPLSMSPKPLPMSRPVPILTGIWGQSWCRVPRWADIHMCRSFGNCWPPRFGGQRSTWGLAE